MNTIDKIRAEIERRKKENMYVDLPMSIGRYYEDRDLLSFLDTMPNESEQPTMGYDEAYLNEKIAKASKSWEGVDVDEYMDEVRGREPVSDDLVEEVKRYYSDNFAYISGDAPTLSILTNIASHFAEWQKEQYTREMIMSDGSYFQNCYELGKNDMRKEMMEGAVEGEVCILPGHVAYVKEKNNESLKRYLIDNFKASDKVKIIIVKENEQ